MKKPQVFISLGDAFQALGSSRYRKDIVRIGKWIHPTTGMPIEFDSARLQRLAANTERYRKNVDKEVVPFPDGHSFKAVDNIGGVTDLAVEGDMLKGTFIPAGKDIDEKLSSGKIRSVSAYIEFGAKDSKGNQYDEVITHVAATPYPVVTGQEDFVKLSSKDDSFEIFIPEALSNGGSDVLKTHDHLRRELQARMDEHRAAHKMNGADHADTQKAARAVQDAAHRLRRQAEVIHSHVNNSTGGPTYMSKTAPEGTSPEGHSQEVLMKKVALALGLAEGASEEQIAEAAMKASKDLKSVQEGRTALSALLEKEHGLKVDGDKVVKLSVDPAAEVPTTPLEKKQAAELAQHRAEKAMELAKQMHAKVEGIIKAGLVPPAKQEILSRLMAVAGKLPAQILSKDLTALQQVNVDVSADLAEFLKDLPSITTQRLSTEQGGDEKKKDEALSAKVDELVARTQPAAAEKK